MSDVFPPLPVIETREGDDIYFDMVAIKSAAGTLAILSPLQQYIVI
jgi:hypothetical protein